MEKMMEFSDENAENKREDLVKLVKENLEKYQDEIKDFSLFTTSKKANGGFSTNDKLPPVQYSSSYDSWYKVEGLPRERDYFRGAKSGYIADIVNNFYTFVAPLGRALHTPDRPGNMIAITLRGEKGKQFTAELVDSVKNLVDTVKPFNERDKNEDLRNILTEAIPVLEAFEDLSKKFPSKGMISVTELIAEYKEMLTELSK
jgi:hypothetical protein